MTASVLYEVVGWIGSALVVISLTQKSILKLRIFGLAGSVALVIYSLLIGAIPIAVVNVVIVFIHAFFIRGLLTKKEDYFEVLKVKKGARYLEHFLEYYQEDIQQFHPGFVYEPSDDQITAFILRDLVPAGLFLAQLDDDRTLHVKLEYVIPQYRDLKVGRYIYSNAELVAGRKCTRVLSDPGSSAHAAYLEKMGFVLSTSDTGEPVYVKDL